MATLASAIDLLSSGSLPQMGDLLIQRLKALEAAARDGTTVIGDRQELLPEQTGATCLEERESAAKEGLRLKRVAELLQSAKKG